MPRRRPLPPALAKEPAFTVATARELGVSNSRLRGSDLSRPFRGLRASPGESATLQGRCRTLALAMPSGDVFSHVTAASLLGLRLPDRLRDTTQIHISTIAPRRPPRRVGVTGHQMASGQATVGRIWGLPVPSPVDTWCQLAEMLSVEELVIVGDGLVQRRSPASTPAAMAEAAARYQGRRGYRRLLAALALIRPGTDSARETILRLAIISDGMPEPEVNTVIVDGRGRRLARGDLVFRQYKVLVEYDGGQHREDERQFNIDIDRLDDVMADGWRAIRVNKSHLTGDRRRILTKIRDALRARGWPGDSPS